MAIKAVVFDLDGTLLDTEKLNTRFWMQAGGEFGFDITQDDCLFIRSLASPLSSAYFEKRFGEAFDFHAVREERRRLMREHVNRYGVEPKPFVIETLGSLKKKGILTAVATATAKDHMDQYLAMIGADRYLDRKICASMVKNGKPAPDIYLYTCGELGIEPSECFAVEDSPNGVRSAYEAGCNVVFIPDLTPADDEIRKKAFVVCETLFDILDYL